MNLYLMHKDIPVAEIETKGATLHIVSIINPRYLPWGVKNVSDEFRDMRLERWLQERCIPKARPDYEFLMNQAGVSSITEMPEKSYMCSITDCYWFKPIHDRATWSDVNFYTNGFDDTMGRVTLNGDQVEITNWNAPELTTNGVLPKRWLQGKNGEFYLLKAGTPPDHKEIYNEAFASQCASLFGLDAVPYAIYHDKETDQQYSICPSFIHDDSEEFVSLEQIRISLGGSKSDALEYLYTIGLGPEVEKLRGFDYIIKNTDRHFGNIGVIRDSNTLEIKRLAPLFDHGFSMVLDKSENDYTQKLTDNNGNEELSALTKLKWVLNAHVVPMELMRRARENYTTVYDQPEALQLATEIARRLYNLQERAEELERDERDIENIKPLE